MKSSLLKILPITLLGLQASDAALVADWRLEEGSGINSTENLNAIVSDDFGTGVSWSSDTPGPASGAALNFDGSGTARVGLNQNATISGSMAAVPKPSSAGFAPPKPTSAISGAGLQAMA